MDPRPKFAPEISRSASRHIAGELAVAAFLVQSVETLQGLDPVPATFGGNLVRERMNPALKAPNMKPERNTKFLVIEPICHPGSTR